MEDQGKDNTSGVKKTSERAKPTIVVVNGKSVLTGGRWNTPAIADFLIENADDKWMKVGELARVSCGSNTIPNKKRVRARLSQLFMELRDRGLFLAIEYSDDWRAASAVKVADLKLETERELVVDKLKRMKKRKELTEEQYEKSITLLNTLMH